MGLRMNNFNIMAVHWKIRFLGGRRGVYKKPKYKEEKWPAWTICKICKIKS